MRLTKLPYLELRRFWRRVLVVLLYLLYSGLLTFWVSLPYSSLTLWVSLAGFTLLVILALVLYIAIGSVSDIHDKDLYPDAKPLPIDERQEKVRNQAYLLAYLILGPSLLVLIFSAQKVDPLWLFTLGLFLYAALPVAVLAWLEPDPIAEDAQDRMRKEFT